MNNIDIKIQVALIALCSAILGAIITAISNYFLNKKLESNKQIKQKQKEIYLTFLRKLQDFKNASDPNSAFTSFQDAVNQVCLYGDNNTSLFVLDYYNAIVSSSLKRKYIDENDHNSHTTKIMNAMRKSLGLKSFKEFSLIKFTPE